MPIEERQNDCRKGLRTMLKNRTELTTIGINSTAPMIDGALTHVTLVALPNGLRAPTNSLVHRTLDDKAREDICHRQISTHKPRPVSDLSESTAHQPTSGDFSSADKSRLVCGSLNGTVTCWQRQFSVVHKTTKMSCDIEQGSFVTILPRCVKTIKNILMRPF